MASSKTIHWGTRETAQQLIMLTVVAKVAAPMSSGTTMPVPPRVQ